jgi:hypothetical protein
MRTALVQDKFASPCVIVVGDVLSGLARMAQSLEVNKDQALHSEAWKKMMS